MCLMLESHRNKFVDLCPVTWIWTCCEAGYALLSLKRERLWKMVTITKNLRASIYGLYFSVGPLFISLLRSANDSRIRKMLRLLLQIPQKDYGLSFRFSLDHLFSVAYRICVLIRHYGCIVRLLSNLPSSVKRLKERLSDKEYLPAATGIS